MTLWDDNTDDKIDDIIKMEKKWKPFFVSFVAILPQNGAETSKSLKNIFP